MKMSVFAVERGDSQGAYFRVVNPDFNSTEFIAVPAGQEERTRYFGIGHSENFWRQFIAATEAEAIQIAEKHFGIAGKHFGDGAAQ